jgi:uncharacterized protein YjbJ (UPF0337 family)
MMGGFRPRPAGALWRLDVDKNRAKGAVKETVGKGKDALGKATGDKNLQADGKADKAEGKVQKTAGKAADAVRSAVK